MTISKDQTVAQCVADNYRTAPIFKKHKIDFCCGGKISIEEACQKSRTDTALLLEELNQEAVKEPPKEEIETLELDALSEYIVEKHHKYVQERIPQIEPFLDKVVRVHGAAHPELEKVKINFQAVKDELLSHMQKEEAVLFPFIKEMVRAKQDNSQLTTPHFGSIKNPINRMEQEHESAGNNFKEIREITNDLNPPEGACNTYRTTFSLLNEFENDLHRHIHLENNILFPKAIVMEEELSK